MSNRRKWNVAIDACVRPELTESIAGYGRAKIGLKNLRYGLLWFTACSRVLGDKPKKASSWACWAAYPNARAGPGRQSRQDSSSELQTSRGGCDNDNALQPLLCRLPRPYHHSATIATDSHAVTAYQLYLYRQHSVPFHTDRALNVAPYDACQQHRNFGHLPPPSARRRRRHACPDYYVPPAEQLTGLLSIRLRQ